MSPEPEQGRSGAREERDPGSPSEAPDTVRGLAARLRELSERLRDPDLPDEQAAELAREAAELVSQAGNEIDRALADGESGG